jgi:hypothetical protein
MDLQRRIIPSFAQNWITAANSGDLVTKLLSRHFPARGFYEYSELSKPRRNVPRLDTVEYKLRVSGIRVHGTSTDTIGNASIDGLVSFRNNTISFIKQYSGENGHLRWEYVGNFTSCGIVGEWHYPNDPPKTRHHRGKFAVWLLSEEGDPDSQHDTQLRMLKDSGKILTRSMSLRSVDA